MTTAARYLFETEFTREKQREAEPRITLAEHNRLMALARESGRAEGLIAGEAMALEAIARHHAIALTTIGDRMANAAHALASLEDRVEAEAVDVAVAVARKLSERLVAREPMDGIRALVVDCLTHLRAVPHLLVRVHDSLLALATEELQALAKVRGFDGRLVIMAEPDIAPGDCRIEWSSGGVMLDRDETFRRIADAVERYVTAPTPSLAGEHR